MVQKGKSDLNADRIAEKSPVHKCQNLAVLDRTFDSIYQGPTDTQPFAIYTRTQLIPDSSPSPNQVDFCVIFIKCENLSGESGWSECDSVAYGDSS